MLTSRKALEIVCLFLSSFSLFFSFFCFSFFVFFLFLFLFRSFLFFLFHCFSHFKKRAEKNPRRVQSDVSRNGENTNSSLIALIKNGRKNSASDISGFAKRRTSSDPNSQRSSPIHGHNNGVMNTTTPKTPPQYSQTSSTPSPYRSHTTSSPKINRCEEFIDEGAELRKTSSEHFSR